MYRVLLDVRDLERYMHYRGIDKDTLEGSIAQYLTKGYSIPTHYRRGFPAKQHLIGTDELDRFFEIIDLNTVMSHLNITDDERLSVLDVSIDNGYLLLSAN